MLKVILYIRKLKRGVSVSIVLACAIVSTSIFADNHNIVCLGGCPIGADQANRLVDHTILRLSQNPSTKFADWVAYRITIPTKTGPSRSRNFKGDPLVPNDEELETSDYTRGFAEININKGHQAPLASLRAVPIGLEPTT